MAKNFAKLDERFQLQWIHRELADQDISKEKNHLDTLS